MAWFRVDDGFNRHRKVMALRRGSERLRCIGLWTLAGSWSSEQELGGLVPDYIIDELGGSQKDVEALARVGLWVREDDTRFHDWDHYQPDAETLQAQRIKESVSGQVGNHRRWHVKRGVTVPDCEFCYRVPDQEPDGEPDRGSVGSASPVPEPEPDSSSPNGELRAADRPEVAALCAHLADHIEANGSKRPPVTAKWLDACRLMLDRDGRTEDEIRGAIDWSQAHEFWRANILSFPKLREKYDQLRMQAERRPALNGKPQVDWEAAHARALAKEASQ